MMRSRFLSLLLLLLLLLSAGGTTVWGQTYDNEGVCCDPSTLDFYDPQTCAGLGQSFEDPADECIEDSDCSDYNAPSCTAIPIDGGLGLLALAGSGLAAARMRRRREEEGLAVEHVD